MISFSCIRCILGGVEDTGPPIQGLNIKHDIQSSQMLLEEDSPPSQKNSPSITLCFPRSAFYCLLRTKRKEKRRENAKTATRPSISLKSVFVYAKVMAVCIWNLIILVFYLSFLTAQWTVSQQDPSKKHVLWFLFFSVQKEAWGQR